MRRITLLLLTSMVLSHSPLASATETAQTKLIDMSTLRVHISIYNSSVDSHEIDMVTGEIRSELSHLIDNSSLRAISNTIISPNGDGNFSLTLSDNNDHYYYSNFNLTKIEDNCYGLELYESVCTMKKSRMSFDFDFTMVSPTEVVMDQYYIQFDDVSFDLTPVLIDESRMAKDSSQWSTSYGYETDSRKNYDVCMRVSNDNISHQHYYSNPTNSIPNSTGQSQTLSDLKPHGYQLVKGVLLSHFFHTDYGFEFANFGNGLYSDSLATQYESFVIYGMENESSHFYSDGEWCSLDPPQETNNLIIAIGLIIIALFGLLLVIRHSRNKEQPRQVPIVSTTKPLKQNTQIKKETNPSHSPVINSKPNTPKDKGDLVKGAKVAGNLAKSAGSVFQGMYQLQRGNIGGAFKSFSNAASNPLSGTTKFEQAEIGNQSVSAIGKSTYTCQNPACNYQFANVSDAKMIGNTPERCPSCNTPVMKDMPWNGENPVQNSISELGKVTYVCMQPSCTYEVGPVPKGTSVGRCMNCGGPMKKKSIH